jgi:signal-transduction protein with cAMP-binding, CBS, and nucleotidyltransferase domain
MNNAYTASYSYGIPCPGQHKNLQQTFSELVYSEHGIKQGRSMNAKIIMQHQKMNELSVDVKAQLIKRLSSLSSLKTVPRKELQWLTEHGHVIIYETGANVAPKGKYIDNLYIILSGKVTIRVDRGAGPRLVAEWQTGEVVGLLPYSRMSGGPGDSYIGEKAEVLAINEKLFPEMIHQCPSFTAFTVHTMLDRAREFNTSDLQDEKMLSLGKLAAGLAHELNNPASATVRDAKLLLAGIENSDEAWQALIAGRLSDRQVNRIMMMRTTFLSRSAGTEMSALQKADHQDKISE